MRQWARLPGRIAQARDSLLGTDYAPVLITISTIAMAAATIALGRDEGAYEEQLEAAVARRSA